MAPALETKDVVPSTDTGHAIRLAARSNTFADPTPGLAPGHLQANLIVLPSIYAADFRLLCQRNPVPSPLLAESSRPGDYQHLISYIPGISGEQIARDLDLRRDIPRYMVYEDGVPLEECVACEDVMKWWSDDHVAFLIGCSFSFERALMDAGLCVNHVKHGRNVPMYRTTLPLCNAGIFRDRTYVVSMRPYREDQIEAIQNVTRPFSLTHGEPITWGWKAARNLGITDVEKPDYGDAPVDDDGDVFTEKSDKIPVFWGCGVTPQNAVLGNEKIKGIVLGHMPGHMLVLDLKEDDIFSA